MKKTAKHCPSCGAGEPSIFYEIEKVPAHSVLLMLSREEALNVPKGNITLAFCEECGFIFNSAFEPTLLKYSERYEETQAFSPTFNEFHRSLASYLIERYDLHNKDICEIGCGKGEFISLLCEMGNNRGIGFDPSYVSERNQSRAKEQITFLNDFYSEKHAHHLRDFVCCKMTLEHIQETGDFISMLGRSIKEKTETTVYFQVPDVRRILRELAFWDIYYEHCSYFSLGSLARLFRKCGFDILDLNKGYEGQYLMIEAQPYQKTDGTLLEEEKDLDALKKDVHYFSTNYKQQTEEWKNHLKQIGEKGERAVIWGAGSKAVSFLTLMQGGKEIEYAVDINPHKHGMFMPATGQEIVPPSFLHKYKPDRIIVMNPIYQKEIRRDLHSMGLAPGIITCQAP